MPLYTALCTKCLTVHPYVRKVADRNDTPKCCRRKTEKQLDAPMVGAMCFTGHKGFAIPGAQKWIEDGATARAYMQQNNLISESEGAQEASRQRANREAADDKKLTAKVVEAYQRNS